jgi:hypothetical protein
MYIRNNVIINEFQIFFNIFNYLIFDEQFINLRLQFLKYLFLIDNY